MARLPGAAINRAATGAARTATNVLLRNQSAYATKKLGFSSSMIGKNIRTPNTKSAKYIIGSSKPPTGKISGAYFSDQYPGLSESLLYLHNDGSLGLEEWVNFDRWYTPDLTKDEISGRHYVFFCRPDLYLVESAGGATFKLCTENGIAKDQFFRYLASYYPQIITSLCAEFANSSVVKKTSQAAATGSGYGNSQLEDGTRDRNGRNLTIHSLIPYLTGRVESLQLPDYTIKNYSLTQPYTKYSIPYASSAIESQTGGTFDITFRDDGDFSVRKLFYAWIYYMDGVMRNRFFPKDKYLKYNCFDYATCIYDILVDATGENILWWTKYTGCFPLSVPISDLSFNRGSTPDQKCSIPWAYYYCEPLNLMSLIDLNFNSLGYIYMKGMASNQWGNPKVSTMPIYNTDGNGFLGKAFVGRPAIFIDESRRQLKLRWLPPPNA